MDGFTMIDSMSDGMCGYVEVKRMSDGATAYVRWSVTSEIDSQSAAWDKAVANLTSGAEIREDHHRAPEPPEEPPYCDRCGGAHDPLRDCPVELRQCDGCGDSFELDELERGLCLDCEYVKPWAHPPDPDTLAENAAHYEQLRQEEEDRR
jgi:hypothetical protein